MYQVLNGGFQHEDAEMMKSNSLISHKIDVIDIHIVWSDMRLNEDCVIWLGIQILDCTFSQNYDDDYATMLFLPQTAGTLSKWSTLSKK
jgi:hypothetical protein